MSQRDFQDPHAERERSRYENPIPSREAILALLEHSVGPMTREEIAEALGIAGEEGLEALRRRLRAMVRDGQLVVNRRDGYGVPDKMNLVRGRVVGHPEGYGFVATPRGEEDIYLSPRQMRRVFDGDEVLVRIVGRDRRGRPEGSIVEVLARNTARVVGRLFEESGVTFVRPDNPRISQDVLVPPGMGGGARPGQMVLLEIVRQPAKENPPLGRVVQVLGEHRAPGMEVILALHNFNIPHEWPEEVEAEVARLPEEVTEEDKRHRVDLRHLAFVTIDGEDAKDFDDAVFCEAKGRGWRLYVAIADVSHYVRPGSALDREAYNRGTSVYFPGQVVPMLPEKLSNELCSLKPATDRLCMVCEMTINRAGKVTGYRFYEGIIHSRARLTYTQVAAMIAQREDPQSPVRRQFRGIVAHVDRLFDLYRALREAREARGAIDFDTPETRILFDESRKIERIVPEERTDAHRLIEECMLAANVCAAELLERSRLPVLYRVHEGPSEERLAALREFLAELGLGLAGGDSPSPADYQEVLEKIAGRPDAHVIQTVMLRSLSRAEYRADNAGHFGLNYPAYTHFTSPIRRYPDLLVHRAIRALLRSGRRLRHLQPVSGAPRLPMETSYPYDRAWMAAAGEHASYTERRADEATRDVETWLKCEYLLDKVGEVYEGVVTAVVSFGLFVELRDLYVEGLVHITSLPKDYYHFEAVHHRLVGERTRRVYRLGDPVRVRVVRVDLEERKVDFELVDEPQAEPRPRRRRAASTGGEAAGARPGAPPQEAEAAGKGRRRRSGGQGRAQGARRGRSRRR
ncbi:MAG: ribonuclease R [Porticoccaceae bacterium]|nr:MAG: ribonuclease R [Porticoccaceae bacterium]